METYLLRVWLWGASDKSPAVRQTYKTPEEALVQLLASNHRYAFGDVHAQGAGSPRKLADVHERQGVRELMYHTEWRPAKLPPTRPHRVITFRMPHVKTWDDRI